MALIGNILWFIFGGGFFAAILWYLFGIIMFITIIGYPFAKAAFRIAGFAAFPFGRDLIDGRLLGEKRITGTGFVNFLWIILAGLWLAISHIFAGIALLTTIIGIPFGLAHFKLAVICFAPLGRRTVNSAVAIEARARAAREELNGYHQNNR